MNSKNNTNFTNKPVCCRTAFEYGEILPGENHTTEYKQYSFPLYTKSAQIFQLKKTICGMTNSLGGVILLGVVDASNNQSTVGKPQVVGYSFDQRMKEDIKKEINSLCRDFYPKLDTSLKDVEVSFIQLTKRHAREEDRCLVRIKVRRGDPGRFYSFRDQRVTCDVPLHNFFFKRYDNESKQVIDMQEIYTQILERARAGPQNWRTGPGHLCEDIERSLQYRGIVNYQSSNEQENMQSYNYVSYGDCYKAPFEQPRHQQSCSYMSQFHFGGNQNQLEGSTIHEYSMAQCGQNYQQYYSDELYSKEPTVRKNSNGNSSISNNSFSQESCGPKKLGDTHHNSKEDNSQDSMAIAVPANKQLLKPIDLSLGCAEYEVTYVNGIPSTLQFSKKFQKLIKKNKFKLKECLKSTEKGSHKKYKMQLSNLEEHHNLAKLLEQTAQSDPDYKFLKSCKVTSNLDEDAAGKYEEDEDSLLFF